jgi:hypothetical protein
LEADIASLFDSGFKRWSGPTTFSDSYIVWEDQAVWNVDFLELFPLATPNDLGQLEKKLLSLLGFDVSLKASEYVHFSTFANTFQICENLFQSSCSISSNGRTFRGIETLR